MAGVGAARALKWAHAPYVLGPCGHVAGFRPGVKKKFF